MENIKKEDMAKYVSRQLTKVNKGKIEVNPNEKIRQIEKIKSTLLGGMNGN